MEKLKLKNDIRKTYLNHLLVLIVAIGASVSNMFVKNDYVNVVFFSGSIIVIFCILMYAIIVLKINKELRND